MTRTTRARRATTTGPHGIDIAAPGGIEALLAFHRAVFGDARMEDPDPDPDDDPDDPDPDDPDKKDPPKDDPAADRDKWKALARKHEKDSKARARELDKLKREGMDEQTAALDDARKAGRLEALRESAGERIDALITARTIGRLSEEQVEGLLEAVNHAKFTDEDGKVDRDELNAWVDKVAPKSKDTEDDKGKRKLPGTTGQGGSGRGSSGSGGAKSSGVAAGRELFEARRGKSKTS